MPLYESVEPKETLNHLFAEVWREKREIGNSNPFLRESVEERLQNKKHSRAFS